MKETRAGNRKPWLAEVETVASRLRKRLAPARRSALLGARVVQGVSAERRRRRGPVVHFVHRHDPTNAGDMASCPLRYFEGYFRTNYRVQVHDIYQPAFETIRSSDVVVLGGGGLLDCLEEWQENINRVLDLCDTVVGWGLGHNRHSATTVSTVVDLDRFALLGLRDWPQVEEGNRAYVPCCSAMGILDVQGRRATRAAGLIAHKDFAVASFTGVDQVSNRSPYPTLINFVREHSAIVSNSYHAIYWATLLNRKAVCLEPFSSKFDHFRYPPAVFSGNVAADIEQARVFPESLTDATQRNLEFFVRVRTLIESRL